MQTTKQFHSKVKEFASDIGVVVHKGYTEKSKYLDSNQRYVASCIGRMHRDKPVTMEQEQLMQAFCEREGYTFNIQDTLGAWGGYPYYIRAKAEMV